jgi:cytochrome d ubiquinol oxidase subunit II
MSYVSLLSPLVLAYIYLAWSAINNRKIDAGEMESDTHVY